MSLRLGGSLLAAAMSLCVAGAGAQTFRVIDLATLAQGNAAVVHGPNVAGAAVGAGTLASVRSAGGQRQGLWFESGATRLVNGPAGSDDTVIHGLNDSGGLVGSANTPDSLRAFSGTLSGASRELPPLVGDTASAAYGINNAGQGVGFSSGAGGQRAVVWDAGGTASVLPSLAGASSSRATGINDRGDVAGVARIAAVQRPVLWPGGQAPVELIPLSGNVSGEASAINARGDVVGYSAGASGARRATLWPWNGVAADLGTLPGGDFSQAFGINAGGDIVGASTSSAGSRAVLWMRSGGAQDLNSLIAPSGFVLTKAVGINDAGAILATGHDAVAGHATGPHTHEDEHDLPVRVFLLIRSGGGL